MQIRRKPNVAQVLPLLRASSLPSSDLSEAKLDHFFACGPQDEPEGVAGVELFGEVGLLRSVAVQPGARGKGRGRLLVEQVESYARQSGVKRLYLLTTTAEKFFESLGYARLDRASVPTAIQASTEFSILCSATAAVMAKTL